MSELKQYFRLMRIHHYIKNLLVFAALACSGQMMDREKFLICVIGFFSFSLLSSSIYVINDIRDLENDKRHPAKCHRPLASGAVSKQGAIILAVLCFTGSMFLNSLVFNPGSTALLLLYFVLNLSYSFGLKNVPILDITILVSGFLIRILYGAFLTGITVSDWLYLTVITISFYFALGKRRNELRQTGEKNTRKVLASYSEGFLDRSMTMCITLANVFYALWTLDEKTQLLYKSRYLVFTVPLVLLITMKYSMDVEEKTSGGDPVEVLLHDPLLLCFVVLYLAVLFANLYF